MDPYRVWHMGREDVGDHPSPHAYRNFLYACAEWLDDRDFDRSALSALQKAFSKPTRKPAKGRRKAVR